MKTKLLFFFVLFLAMGESLTFGQSVTRVIGTIVDPNSVPYYPANVQACLTSTGSVQPTTSGLTLTPNAPLSSSLQTNYCGAPAATDSSGNFAMFLVPSSAVIPSGTQYTFTVQTLGTRPPAGKGSQTFTSAAVTISGATQDVSVSINAAGPAQLIPSGASGFAVTPTRCSGQVPDGVDAQGNAVNCQTVAVTSQTNAWPAQQNFDANMRFKGPNPYVDATAYGVRALNPNTTPAAVGLTANCTNGSAVVTISAASTFVNGDGVVLYGCGAPHAMTTPGAPTVQPSLARSGTGTGDVVNDLVGATTYNYQVIARKALGGLTAASAVGSTTTGSATLGAQTPVSLTSCSRANDVVTCVTASAHALVTNSMIYMTGVADTTFDGWYLVSGSADNTHFTFVSGLDTRNGATTATTGGTVKGFNCNHVSWSSVAGAFEYYIYGRTGGSLTLLGVSRSVNGIFVEGSLYWDDFGSPMMDGTGSFPAYVPNTPPGAATSDHLVTTIVSGAGTTTLTLANAAGTTVSGATIRFDNYPNALAAVTANYSSNIGPPIYFPVPASTVNAYVFNSYSDFSTNAPVFVVPSGLWMNDTLNMGGMGKLIGGTTTPTKGSQASFQQESLPTFQCGTAIPCIQLTAANNGPRIEGMLISGLVNNNNNLLVMQDGGGAGGGASYSRVFFSTSSANGDYMGIALYARGLTGVLGAAFDMDHVNFSGGPSQTDGSTATPLLFCDDCVDARTKNLMFNRRGIFFNPDTALGSLKIDRIYIQGGISPFLFLSSPRTGNSTIGTIELSQVTLDTTPHAVIAYIPSGGIYTPITKIFPILGGGTGRSTLTGNPMATVINFGLTQDSLGQNKNSFTQQNGAALDGLFNTNTSGPTAGFSSYRMNAAIGVGASYELFIDSPAPSAPSGAVSAGGSVPVGNFTYKVVPVWQNGGEGNYSPASATVTTTGGNQTVTLSWTPVSGNCRGYNIIRNNVHLVGTQPAVSGCASSSYIDTTASAFGTSSSIVPAGGPTMMMPGTQGIATPALMVAGSVVQRMTLANAYTNATTTASNITGLSFPAAVSQSYGMTCQLYYQASVGTAGLDITITGPASPTNVFYSYDEDATGTTLQDSVANAFGTKLVGNATVTATTDLHATVTLGLINGTTAGTVQVKGSATGVGTVTIQPGSYCSVN